MADLGPGLGMTICHRPLGAADFVADLERRLGRPITRRAAGLKPSRPAGDQPKLL